MTDHTEAEFAKADRAVERTAATIASAIEKLLDAPYETVARDYLFERLLRRLTGDHVLAREIDRVSHPGPATLQLANALADYHDARFQDR
jgi:hypothetical protein